VIIPLHLRAIVIGLSFGLLMVSMVAFVSEDSGDASASNEPVRLPPTAVTQHVGPPDIDALIAEILERPLFSPSRQPAEAAPEQISETPTAQPKMPGRLEGVSIRPEAREALFEREGANPIAVKEGQEIDGWTVASIRPDQVLLKSVAGEQIVRPATDAGIKPQMQAINKKPLLSGKKPHAAGGAAGAAMSPIRPQRPDDLLIQGPARPDGRTGR
jgi:hypothetical protein